MIQAEAIDWTKDQQLYPKFVSEFVNSLVPVFGGRITCMLFISVQSKYKSRNILVLFMLHAYIIKSQCV